MKSAEAMTTDPVPAAIRAQVSGFLSRSGRPPPRPPSRLTYSRILSLIQGCCSDNISLYELPSVVFHNWLGSADHLTSNIEHDPHARSFTAPSRQSRLASPASKLPVPDHQKTAPTHYKIASSRYLLSTELTCTPSQYQRVVLSEHTHSLAYTEIRCPQCHRLRVAAIGKTPRRSGLTGHLSSLLGGSRDVHLSKAPAQPVRNANHGSVSMCACSI